MKIKFFYILFLLMVTSGIHAQIPYLTIHENIRLPKDSIIRKGITESLNVFLYSVKEGGSPETRILPDEKTATQILIKEIQGIIRDDTTGVTPYLINLEALEDKTYLAQIAYLSLSVDSQPLLKGMFELIVHPAKEGVLFSSPLSRNTKEWKTRRSGHLVFHYQNDIAEGVIDQYIRIVPEYDRKLGINKTTEYYLCDDCRDLPALLRLAGIHYKIDYNGFAWPMVDFETEEKKIALYNRGMSRKEFVDPHDAFHGRANMAVPVNVRNYYMICGCAYIYGGTWSGDWRIDWDGIQQRFKETLFNDKETDWLTLYFERYNFGESRERPIILTQFINALLIQKVEEEQGFAAVMKLFASGNMYQDRNRFFTILEEVTGINEKNFNKKTGHLIEDSFKPFTNK